MIAMPAVVADCRMKTAYLPGDIERKAGLILRIPGGNSEPAGARQIANQSQNLPLKKNGKGGENERYRS